MIEFLKIPVPHRHRTAPKPSNIEACGLVYGIRYLNTAKCSMVSKNPKYRTVYTPSPKGGLKRSDVIRCQNHNLHFFICMLPFFLSSLNNSIKKKKKALQPSF